MTRGRAATRGGVEQHIGYLVTDVVISVQTLVTLFIHNANLANYVIQADDRADLPINEERDK
jgi:uncharacterized protein (DUF3084 family)